MTTKTERKQTPILQIGYEVKRFVNQPALINLCICSICSEVFLDPIITPCEHMFCSWCIKNWLAERFTCPIDGKALQVDQLNQPNSQFLNFYINLELKCKYLDDGCKEVLSVALIESHEKNCWHRIKECVHNNCSLSEEAPGKELHKATCTNRLLECDHCHNHIQYWNMVTHRYKTCPETEVLCECGQIITRRLLNSHYADECANTVFKYHLIDCAERFQMSEPKKYISDPKRLTFLCNQVENIKPTMEKTVEKLIERNMEKTTETIMEQLTKQLEEMQTNISLIQDKTKVVQLQTQKYLHWQMSKNPKTIHWIIKDPDLSAANKEYIESPEFYSFPSGICFGVKVYMNGVNEESMGFISVHFYLRSGLFDDDISWPFDKKVTVDLKVGQGAGYSLQRNFFDASRGSDQEIFKKAGRPKKNGTGQGLWWSKFIPVTCYSQYRLQSKRLILSIEIE